MPDDVRISLSGSNINNRHRENDAVFAVRQGAYCPSYFDQQPDVQNSEYMIAWRLNEVPILVNNDS